MHIINRFILYLSAVTRTFIQVQLIVLIAIAIAASSQCLWLPIIVAAIMPSSFILIVAFIMRATIIIEAIVIKLFVAAELKLALIVSFGLQQLIKLISFANNSTAIAIILALT